MFYNREVYIAQWRRIKITTVKKRNSKLKEKKRTIITCNLYNFSISPKRIAVFLAIDKKLRIVFPYGVQAELLCYRYRKRI
uniref:Uncharacterized protein n=1 Tax=Rhizophagus irregularis (strain DAOM 181602 / DAOM 197198 / MUCL 43194) TaxID=747089 RepID=U9SHY6_RHIID